MQTLLFPNKTEYKKSKNEIILIHHCSIIFTEKSNVNCPLPQKYLIRSMLTLFQLVNIECVSNVLESLIEFEKRLSILTRQHDFD